MATAPAPAGGGVTGAAFMTEVRKFLGDAYVYGAAGPATFDCSGLVQYALAQLGISAPRTSEAQWAWVDKISKSQLQVGDLVFMQFPGDSTSPGHVEIYIGGGNVLGADDPSQGVAITSLASVAGNIVGYGRVPGVTYSGSQAATSAAGASSTAAAAGGGASTWDTIWAGIVGGLNFGSSGSQIEDALSGAATA